MSESKLMLTDNLLIGKGAHKATYIHPENPNVCVKILFQTPDIDWEREKQYRRSRQLRHLTSDLLPVYFGEVDTNLGTGYVFERVCNYDGSPSISIQDFLKQADSQDPAVRDKIINLLVNFKQALFKERIMTSNMEPANFLIQMEAPSTYRIRVIDNIGSSNHLPLAFYFDCVADARLKRYWDRFVKELKRDFPQAITDEILQNLYTKFKDNTSCPVLQLSCDELLGKGHHKVVYTYPNRPMWCVKIVYDHSSFDVWRELRYRRARDFMGWPSSMLTKYNGTVETNLGTGFVYERIVDYDGQPSQSLKDYILAADNPAGMNELKSLIEEFRQLWRQELVIVSDTNPDNFAVQKITPTRHRLRIVDNIGSGVRLPIIFYSRHFARKRIQRYWKRFLREMRRDHPNIINEDFVRAFENLNG